MFKLQLVDQSVDQSVDQFICQKKPPKHPIEVAAES